MTGQPAPCPVCTWAGGFHKPTIHNALEVPTHLTWKPGEPPPWDHRRYLKSV